MHAAIGATTVAAVAVAAAAPESKPGGHPFGGFVYSCGSVGIVPSGERCGLRHAIFSSMGGLESVLCSRASCQASRAVRARSSVAAMLGETTVAGLPVAAREGGRPPPITLTSATPTVFDRPDMSGCCVGRAAVEVRPPVVVRLRVYWWLVLACGSDVTAGSFLRSSWSCGWTEGIRYGGWAGAGEYSWHRGLHNAVEL